MKDQLVKILLISGLLAQFGLASGPVYGFVSETAIPSVEFKINPGLIAGKIREISEMAERMRSGGKAYPFTQDQRVLIKLLVGASNSEAQSSAAQSSSEPTTSKEIHSMSVILAGLSILKSNSSEDEKVATLLATDSILKSGGGDLGVINFRTTATRSIASRTWSTAEQVFAHFFMLYMGKFYSHYVLAKLYTDHENWTTGEKVFAHIFGFIGGNIIGHIWLRKLIDYE